MNELVQFGQNFDFDFEIYGKNNSGRVVKVGTYFFVRMSWLWKRCSYA